MFFRNLTIFRFPVEHDFSQLDALLADAALKPVGPLELSSRGFISPFGRGESALSHRIGDAIWLTVGGEDKILPGSVINDQLAQKIAEIEDREGRRLGGRARKRMKDDLLHELLPRAFVRPSRTDALLDLAHGFLAVDTPSRKNAETVASEIRRALGSFPALPPNPQVAPRSVLTGWVAGEPLPDGLALGEECELKDAMDGGGRVRINDMALQGDEIEKHLEAGKQATRLALSLDDHLSFVLGEDLVIRKLRFLEGAVDQLESTERDDLRAELDARFALLAGEVRRLFLVLAGALRLEAPAAPEFGPATSTVTFEDQHQDFLEWDLDDAGYVVGCRPFQGSTWCGRRVLNLPEVGKLLRITTHDGGEMVLKYPVTSFGPVKAR